MPRLRLFVLLVLLSMAASTSAQWLNYPTPGTPRTSDGKPNLTAPAPRVNGKPDLSGVWQASTPLAEWRRLLGDDAVDTAIKRQVPGREFGHASKYATNILLDFKPEESPLRPGVALRGQAGNTGTNGTCLPFGIPLANLAAIFKVVQSPRLTVFMYEQDDTHRQIYTDGRDLPKEVAQPSWLGYSVGKWERDTFVVETTGFNDKTVLDGMGHPHSEALRLVERYRRRDFGHMDVEMTFDDPQMYTRPFTIKFTQDLQADSDIFEYICNENEKDRAHMGRE